MLGGKIRRGVAESWLGSIWEDENKRETFLYLYANWTTLSMCSAVSFLFVSQFGVFVFIKSSFDERCPVSNTAGCLGTTSLRWKGVKISLVMPLYELAASSVVFLRPTQVKMRVTSCCCFLIQQAWKKCRNSTYELLIEGKEKKKEVLCQQSFDNKVFLVTS